MKKIITTAMLSLGVMALAQSGNVGINTERPSATLEVGVTNVNKTNNTNQGFIAPRLSKVRVANIAQPVQGTLVYVLDENTTEYPNSLISAYTGSDAKVADINEKGYYFYNGTKWVKTSGTTSIGSTGRGPFNVIGTNNAATGNTQDIYQMGKVAIGTKEPDNGSKLFVDSGDQSAAFTIVSTSGTATQMTIANTKNGANYADIGVLPDNGFKIEPKSSVFMWLNEKGMGVDTADPKATLQVGGIYTNIQHNTNEGIIAPRLSKSRVASIAVPVEGTLIYVIDEYIPAGRGNINDYNGNDSKVADITEKGYYYYNGTKWVKTSSSAIAGGNTGPFNVIGTNNAATGNTQDIYQMGRVAIGTNTISNPTAQMEIASRGSVPLVLRTNSEYSGLILRNMENAYAGISVGPNGSAYITSTQNGQEGIKGIKLTSAAEGANVIIGDRILNDYERSKAKLDVQGNIVARGLGTGIVEAYIGGDEVPADNSRSVVDVEVGSVKAGVTDVTLYNPTDNKAMNLFVADVKSSGNITSNSLAGEGVRNVVADIDGRLVARRNIRTVNGLRDTLIPGDNFGYVYVTTNTTQTITITVPSNLPAGFSCVIVQKGTGQVIVQGQGVTLETARGTKTRARYSAIGVIKDTSNTATITGDAVN